MPLATPFLMVPNRPGFKPPRGALLRAALVCIFGLVLTGGLLPNASASPKQVRQWAQKLAADDLDAATNAAASLGNEGSKAAREALLSALSVGLHPKVAEAALLGLAKVADSSCFDTMLVYTRSRSEPVRAAAYRGLANLSDKRAEAKLLNALDDESGVVRKIAIEEIERAENRAAMPKLVSLIEKGDLAAGKAFGSMADAEDARKIAETVGRFPDDALAMALGTMLLRPEFDPEPTRVQVVRAMSKLRTKTVKEMLSKYSELDGSVGGRDSLKEARAVLDSLSGGTRK